MSNKKDHQDEPSWKTNRGWTSLFWFVIAVSTYILFFI